LALDQQPPALKDDQVSVDSNLINQGWVPTFLTAYGSDVYLVLTASKFAGRAMLLSYDANNWHNAPQTVEISISPELVSVAAFPNKQLFLLTSDGHVKTLQYDANGNKPQPSEIALQSPVSPPLANDGTDLPANTPVAVPVPPSPQ